MTRTGTARTFAWALATLGLLALAGILASGSGGLRAAEGDPTLEPPTAWMGEPQPVEGALAATPEEMRAYTETIPGTNVSFEMVPIPAGTFLMGSPDAEAGREASEGPQFTVALEPFWMGKCEVTWNEYDLWCMGEDKARRAKEGVAVTPWDLLADAVAQPTAPYMDMTLGLGRDGFPAINMTQFAAKIYSKWLCAKTGRYYRLPSEAEWEYACRAGSQGPWCFGDDEAKLADYGWFFGNSDSQTHPVGGKLPNAWGLCDMHGNAMEWTLDQFTPTGYPVEAGASVSGPVVVPEKSYPRAVRGGSFMDDPAALRSAARRGSSLDWMKNDPQYPQSIWYHTDAWGVGFRVVRPFVVPSAEEMAKYDVDARQAKEYQSYPKSRVHGG